MLQEHRHSWECSRLAPGVGMMSLKELNDLGPSGLKLDRSLLRWLEVVIAWSLGCSVLDCSCT